jgi:multidrug efflux pump subunit AcrB
VVAGAVLISAFVSLSLTPVLNVLMTKKVHKHSWFYTKTEPFFEGMERGFRNSLKWLMARRWIAIAGFVVSVCLIFFIGRGLQSELAPMEDRSRFRLQVTAPEGTSYDAMDQYMDQLVQLVLDSVPERKVALSITAPGFSNGTVNSGMMNVRLSEPNERNRSQSEIVQSLGKNLQKFNFGKALTIQEQTIAVRRSGSALPIVFVLQNIDFSKLQKVLPRFLDEANSEKTFQGVDADLKFNKPELSVSIDRLKASSMGISISDVSQTLQFALSNRRLGYFTMSGKQYQVIGQVNRENRDVPVDLTQYYVRGRRGDMISLDNIVSVKETTSPSQIFHYNRYKSATISANLAPGKTIGDGIKAMQGIYTKLKDEKLIDDSFNSSLAGSSLDYVESSSNILFAFLLALGLIYLILAAQFESFVDPLIIMLTVPLALAGAVLTLGMFNQTLNIFSQIGMIVLIGLVTKNGILIVEYANHVRGRGTSKIESAIEGAALRFRPILMTSLAMIFGALPIALSLGAASTSRKPLGMVIVGGVTYSLVLSLFIVPVIYTFISRKKGTEDEDLKTLQKTAE